jgi:hypothetical protein
MSYSARQVITLSLLVLFPLAGFSRARQYSFADRSLTTVTPVPPTRTPLGVYAKVDIELAIKGFIDPPNPVPANFHPFLRRLYRDLLDNPAISGITIGAHWDQIQLEDPICATFHNCAVSLDGYDWSYLDDAFEEAHRAHKSVQLIITPGVDSPPWLLDKLEPCDGLFASGEPSATGNTGNPFAHCGKVTFVGFPEVQRADGNPPVLPLPWNGVYKHAWWDFLEHLAVNYQSDTAFVSIAVAGAICASTEIILPTSANSPPQPAGSVDSMWARLINNSFPDVSDYQQTDQVFIDEWKCAIDEYERIFSGVTLFISPNVGKDLPEFVQNLVPVQVHDDNTLYCENCRLAAADGHMRSCEAKTEILSHFVTVTGRNAKATRVGGMKASNSNKTGDIGLPGVKLLTLLSLPGGAEFDHPVTGSANFLEQGCPDYPDVSKCTDLTKEQAAYNVLKVFFHGTPAADFYRGEVTAHVQYLEVPYLDVEYANTHPFETAPVANLGSVSLENLLYKANQDLFEMANRRPPPPRPHNCF